METGFVYKMWEILTMRRVSGRWSPKCGSLPRDAGDLVGLRLWCGLSRAPRNYVLAGGPDAAFCQITLITCLGLVVGSVVLVFKSWYKGHNAPVFRSLAVYREMMRRVGDCLLLHFARVVDNAKCIFVTCVCVCLSVCRRMPTLLHGPGCNLGEW